MNEVIATYNRIASPPHGVPQPLQASFIRTDVEEKCRGYFYALHIRRYLMRRGECNVKPILLDATNRQGGSKSRTRSMVAHWLPKSGLTRFTVLVNGALDGDDVRKGRFDRSKRCSLPDNLG